MESDLALQGASHAADQDGRDEVDAVREVSLVKAELQQLRIKAAAQEESLQKYRMEAEQLIAGNDGTGGNNKANGLMKTWLRDAKKQSEDLKTLFEQSRTVAAESAAMAKRDYERKMARLQQDLAESEKECAVACADKVAAEDALLGMKKQVSNACEQRNTAKAELEAALERHRVEVLRLETAHHDEVAKMAAANHQYQQLVKEQSHKAAAQEKSMSEMFEKTLNDMRSMMERSRETRDKERKDAATMLESATQTANRQKKELDEAKVELITLQDKLGQKETTEQKMRDSLANSEATVQELQDALAKSQEKRGAILANFARARLSHVEAKFALYQKLQMVRVLGCWSSRAQANNLATEHMYEILDRNEHVSMVHWAYRKARQQREHLFAMFTSWLSHSSLIGRGHFLRSKCTSSLLYGSFSGWMAFKAHKTELVLILDGWKRRMNCKILQFSFDAIYCASTTSKSRRDTAIALGCKTMMQGLHEIMLAWASTAISNDEEANKNRSRVLARSLCSRGLRRAMSTWKAHFCGWPLHRQRLRIVKGRNRQQSMAGALSIWAYRYKQKRKHLRMLKGCVQRSMVHLLTGCFLSWYERMEEATIRKEEQRDLVSSKKILQQHKDVLSSEVEELRDKLKTTVDALNIAKKVNRVHENELAKMQNETLGTLQGEVEAGKDLLEFSRVQYEAKESDYQAACVQNAILQDTIEELNELLGEVRGRLDQAELDFSSARTQAQQDIHREQQKAKVLEEKLRSSESELETIKGKCNDLQSSLTVMQVEPMQSSFVQVEGALEQSSGNTDLDSLFVNFQEEVERQAREELDVKEAEAAALRAQISLLQTALRDVNLELEQALESRGTEVQTPSNDVSSSIEGSTPWTPDAGNIKEIELLRARNQVLKQECECAQHEKQEAVSAAAEAHSKCAQLAQEVAQLQKSFNGMNALPYKSEHSRAILNLPSNVASDSHERSTNPPSARSTHHQRRKVQSFHDTSSGSEDSCVVIMDSSHGTQDPELETNSSCAEVGVESTTLGKHQGRTEEIAAASPRNSVVRSDEPVVGEGSKDSGALIRQPVTTFSRRRFVESESSDSSPVTRPTPLTPRSPHRLRDDKQWNGGAKASKLNHEGKKVVREVLSQASSQHIENEPNEGLEQIATHHPSAPSKEGHGVPEDEKEVQDKKETSDKTQTTAGGSRAARLKSRASLYSDSD